MPPLPPPTTRTSWCSAVTSGTSARRVGRGLEEPREVYGVGGRGRVRGGGRLGTGLVVLVVDTLHRLADPVGPVVRRDREARVVERLQALRDDVVRAVLVADRSDDGDLAVGQQP